MNIFKKAFVVLFALIGLVMVSFAQERPFASEMEAFQQADKKSKPADGVYLFVGSSSIKMWDNLAESFPGKPVLNRGFGGSTLAEVSQNIDIVIYPYNPREIIIYAGENDIAAGVSAVETFNRFKTLFGQIRNKFPKTPLVFISIKPAPSREKFLPVVKEANDLIQSFIRKNPNTFYIDVFSRMLNEDGSFKSIYLDDNLHMTHEGYAIWTQALKPVMF